MSTWCSKHVEAWNKTYCKSNFVHQVGWILRQIYWDARLAKRQKMTYSIWIINQSQLSPYISNGSEIICQCDSLFGLPDTQKLCFILLIHTHISNNICPITRLDTFQGTWYEYRPFGIRVQVKVKVNQSRYKPGVAQRVPVKFPRFHDNGTGWL